MEKISGIFAWKLLKKMKTLPIDDQNQGIFFHKLGHFFQFLKKGWGDLPPCPPSSYAPGYYISYALFLYNHFVTMT